MTPDLKHFLTLIIQICISETPYLKQLFIRKYEREGQKKFIGAQSNSDEVKQLWRQAMKKEAVHLLMRARPNSAIADLKEHMNDFLNKDKIFEEVLFETST